MHAYATISITTVSKKIALFPSLSSSLIQVQPGLFCSCSLEPIAQWIEASSQSFSV